MSEETPPVGDGPSLAAIEALARRGDFDEARRSGVQLLAAASPGSIEAAEIENLLGGIAFEQGKTDEAEARFEQAIRTARALGHAVLVARAANNLASIAHLRGKLTLATSLFESALAVFEAIESNPGEAQVCHNLAMLSRDAGNCEEASGYAERAVRAARRSGDFALEGLTLTGRAETALRRGAYEAARADVDQARRLARRAKDGLGLAEASRLAGAIALAQGNPAEALREASLGYRRATACGALQIATECADLAARSCRLLHRPRLGRRYYRTAVEGYRSLGATPALKRLTATLGG